MNLLQNPGFEADWSDEKSHRCLISPGNEYKDIGNIFTPPGWVTWFHHRPGTWDQPEVRDAWKQNDPRRVRSGQKGMLLFTCFRNHNAGFLQQVQTTPGAQLRLTAWAHAWSNSLEEFHHHDGRWSEGAGWDVVAWPESDNLPHDTGDPQTDAKPNFTFWVGIDPTGGTDPFANTVIWGEGYHIYNGYCQELSVEAIAQGDTVTVFLCNRTLWAFQHNDAYWDDVELTVAGQEPIMPPPLPTPPTPPPPPTPPVEPDKVRGQPRTQYERTYVLLPPSAGIDIAKAVVGAVWDREYWTIGASADDAGIGDLDMRRVIAIAPQEWGEGEGGAGLAGFFEKYYPGVEYCSLPFEREYQLVGRLAAYSLKESGFRLMYPTTHTPMRVTSEFGAFESWRTRVHCGLDLASSWSAWADEILSATDGTVITAGYENNRGGFGYRVRVQATASDGREVLIRYAHLTADGVYVSAGDQVHAGQKLGRPGSTGISTGDHLHIDVFVDGGYADPEILLESSSPPPATRLIRGVHGAPVTSPPPRDRWNFWLDELDAIGIKWFKTLCLDHEWLSALLTRGVTPIVRLYQGEKYPGRLDRGLMSQVPGLVEIGVRYFEPDNEPNLNCEWKGEWRDRMTWQDTDLVKQVALDWWADAQEIIRYGGVPLFPAMAPTDRNGTNERFSSVAWMQLMVTALDGHCRQELADLLRQKKIGAAVHASPFLRPFDFSPYREWGIDDMCLRGYEVVRDTFRDTFGVDDLLIISTEGGCYEPGHLEDLGWSPAYSEEEWAQKTVGVFEWLERHGTLAAMCPWILTDEGVSDSRWMGNGWYRNRTPRPVAMAMKEAT